MTVGRGEVWWGPAPHKSSPAYRPWVVVSEASHPFAAEECIGVAMTTRRHDIGIAVPPSAWRRGGSSRDTFVSPWYVATLKHRDLDRHQGTLDERTLTDALAELHRYTPLPAPDGP